MNSLKVVDVTLRDGGCVNDFNFGQSNMEKILAAQEAAGLDIIEMGYLDEEKGSEYGHTKYSSETVISKTVLKDKKQNTAYVVMIDYGRFDIDRIHPRTINGIDGIRLAFHKKNKADIISLGRRIMDKGYQFYIQPMVTFRYSDRELLELIDLVNQELPDASGFYIVDSFGEMRPNDMNRIMNLVDHNLIQGMALGFHSHNNLQMAYSNAVALLQFPTRRDLMVDSSIMGMGKGAGNLNTELLLEHLNLYYGKRYRIAPLLEVMDKVINQIHNEFYWGYAPEYYLSSAHHCSPSYASHFYGKHMLTIDQVGELLGMLDEEKKISFDLNYAEKMYRQYNERCAVEDTESVELLRSAFSDKKVLVIAPGKSIINTQYKLAELLSDEDTIGIGLNLTREFGEDYLLVTRKEIYGAIRSKNKRIITTSNISADNEGNQIILNYGSWIEIDDGITYDSSFVIVLKLLQSCNVKEILLAGMDGFSIDINENYMDAELRHPINAKQVESRNAYYKHLIGSVRKQGIKISFITPSRYE